MDLRQSGLPVFPNFRKIKDDISVKTISLFRTRIWVYYD
jgi:hypothetical protein